MSKEKRKEKAERKKEKIVYIDDQSTIADMSATRKTHGAPPKKDSTFKEKARTYFSVVKKMLLPMCITLVAFTAFCLLFVLLAK